MKCSGLRAAFLSHEKKQMRGIKIAQPLRPLYFIPVVVRMCFIINLKNKYYEIRRNG
ncbi:MAG: hypothetical protein RLY43_552, partial [Bacteroidota bacterium]